MNEHNNPNPNQSNTMPEMPVSDVSSIPTVFNKNKPDSGVEKVGIGVVPAVLLTLFTSIASVAIYHQFIVPKPVKFGLLDVQKISSNIENEARATIVNNLNATDADRENAAKRYESKLLSLQEAINKIGSDCNCVLIVKAAALNAKGGKLTDYTADAEKMLGFAQAQTPVAVPAPSN